MADNTYKPIACQLYDQLEILAMRKVDCNISYRAAEQTKTVQGKIVDLFPISGIGEGV